MSPDAAADRNSSRSAEVAQAPEEAVSHNLNGQRLGRKGRDTRDRILAATVELLEGAPDEPITLSAVARKAKLGMTSLYNYFTDLTELLLAVLEPVMASSEEAFLSMLRERWPDEELGDRCYRFLLGYYAFWARHSRLLHLRNSMSDGGDQRMLVYRVNSTNPIIALLAAQIDAGPDDIETPGFAMATVLMTGIERTITVTTDRRFTDTFEDARRFPAEHYLKPEARLMELAIRDTRERMARNESF